MRPLAISREFADRTEAILNAAQHEISGRIAVLSRGVEQVERHALDALAHDREVLVRKIELINRVSDKALGLVTAVPVPIPEMGVQALEAAAKKLREEVIGDMRREMESAMGSAESHLQEERMVLLSELHTKRIVIANQTKALIAKHREIMTNADLPEVERYEQLREVEKGLSTLEAFTETFNAQMESLGRATTAAEDQARELAAQGPETGHQEAVKRMPEQHGMTQAMYQRAVLEYMKTRFADTRNAPLLKSEEIKMLEQAFPDRFVMKRTPGGEWSKQRAEVKREKTKFRVQERAQIEATVDKDAIRAEVARKEATKRFPKTGARLRKAQEKAIQKEVDRLMDLMCDSHVIEHEVNKKKVDSPLDPSKKVCPSTAERHRKLAAAIDPDAVVSGTRVAVPADGILKISSFRAGDHTKDCIHEVLRQEREKLALATHNDPFLQDDECQRISDRLAAEASTHGEAADLDIAKAQMFKEALEAINAIELEDPMAQTAARVERFTQFEAAFAERFSTDGVAVTAAEELSHFESFTALQAEKVAHASHVVEADEQRADLEAEKATIEEKISALRGQLSERSDSTQFNEGTTAAISAEIEALDGRLKSLSGSYDEQKSALSEIDGTLDQCQALLPIMAKTDPLHFNSDDTHKFPSIVRALIETDTSRMSLQDKVTHDHLTAAVIAKYRSDPAITPKDISDLRGNVALQTQVLQTYQALSEIERVTPRNVGEKIEKFHAELASEIERIEAKGDSGKRTARKLALLKGELKKLEGLQLLVGTHVSFTSIQTRLTEVVDNVMQAAQIQRNRLHIGSTSTSRVLDEFKDLKDALSHRREEVEAAANDDHGAGHTVDGPTEPEPDAMRRSF